MRVALKPVLVDALLAAVLTGLTLATLGEQTPGRPSWGAVVLAVLSVAPVALRQSAPVITMSVIVATLAAYGLLDYGELPSGGVGMLVAMFTVATLRPWWVAAVMFAATEVVVVTIGTTDPELAWSQAAQAALVVLGAWVLGDSTRRWAARVQRSAARAAEAVAAERVRIARELHDIVAHHMSVISLQAGVAQYVIDNDPPTARTAIATVAGASRDALADLRRLLDVLRVDADGEPDLSPQPGLAQLGDLVRRFRAAGLPVDVTVAGDGRALAPGPDLCAYRTVQESLTNVLKHAGPATARVCVEYGDATLTVTVADDGTRTAAPQPPATSHGIRGMRERAALYGGALTAGPAAGGGFTVVLRLPLAEQP